VRYDKGRKEETRRRVVEAASSRFRRDGIGGTGVAALMADAGLTHGGFYAHFASKDDLVQEAVSAALSKTRDLLASEAKKARERGGDGLARLVEVYLSPAHCDKPEAGCAVAALAPELARHDPAIRDVLTKQIQEIVSIIAAELPPTQSKDTAYAVAYGIFGTMVGTLQLARVVNDAALSETIISSGRASALALAQRCV
jgi:TetR/AcrR family transcriptional regulator, transcriptional repressor for nem operon